MQRSLTLGSRPLRCLVSITSALTLATACNNKNGEATDETRETVELISQDPAFDIVIPGFTAEDLWLSPATVGGTWNHGGRVGQQWTRNDPHVVDTQGTKHLIDSMTALGWTVTNRRCGAFPVSLTKSIDQPVGSLAVEATVSSRDGNVLLGASDGTTDPSLLVIEECGD